MVIYYQWSSPLRRGKIYILRLVHVVRCKIFWLTSFLSLLASLISMKEKESVAFSSTLR